MLRILLILVIISISYWLGYWVQKRNNNYRPVCFVYKDASEPEFRNQVEIYWGYWDMPNSNDSLWLYKVSFSGHSNAPCYFMLNMKKLLSSSQGKNTTIVVNAGYYNKRHKQSYMQYLYGSGFSILFKQAKWLRRASALLFLFDNRTIFM